MTFEDLLSHHCQLGSLSTSSNSLGEVKQYWTYSSTDTICRFVPIVASQRVELAGHFDNVKYTAYLESGAAVSGGKRIQFGGKEYRINDMHLDSSYHHKVCLVAEL